MAKLTVQPFISADDWKALGPMGRMRDPLGATERSGIYDDNAYDGSSLDRVEAERPYQAHIWAGGPNKILGNPNRNSHMDPFTLEQSQYFHLMEVLDRRDKSTLKLVLEAARTGNKAAVQAGELAGGSLDHIISYADAAQNLMDRFSGTDAKGRKLRSEALARDEIDMAASAMAGRPAPVKASPDFTVIAPSAAEARVLRAFIDSCLRVYPPETQFEGQKLPKSVDELDVNAIRASFQKTGRPSRFGSREDGLKAVAVFASSGYGDAAAQYVKGLPANLSVVPQKNPELWDSLKKIDGRGHWRIMAFRDAKNWGEAVEKVIDAADVVAVHWNGDHRCVAMAAAAYAARTGKLGRAFGPEGEDLNVYRFGREAMAAHMSKAEFARAQTLEAFDIEAGAPRGRFALSLVRAEKEGTIPTRDIEKLAALGMTINEIADISAHEQGRESLLQEHRISGVTLSLLGNEKVMANARSAYLRAIGQLDKHGVSLIGPDSFPRALRDAPNAPAYLFAQGDIDALRSGPLVGVIGEASGSDVVRGIVASRAAPAIAALASGTVTPVELEGSTNVPVPVTGRHVLLLSSGHGHVAGPDPEVMLARRDEILEKGGVILSRLPPEEAGSFYDMTIKKVRGRPSSSTELSERAAAKLMGATVDALLVTQLGKDPKMTTTRAAILAHLHSGRRPAVINHDDLHDIREVAGSRAMLARRGAEAFEKSGFQEADVIALQERFTGARLGIDVGPNPRRAMDNLVRHIKGESLDLPARPAGKVRDDAEVLD